MTAKINIAINSQGQYVKIQDAIRGQEYFCLNCKEKLFPSKGEKNIHHFRHFTKKDRAILIECELYSSGNSDYEVLMNERTYENRIRFTIDQSWYLKMRLPYLEGAAFSRMNFDDLYFRIQVQGESIFSSDLGQKSRKRFLDVPLQSEYKIEIDKMKNAQFLKYEVENKILLFRNTVLLFKRMQGEFINIPYQKTNLSDEFFLISTSPITFPDELTIKSQSIINEINIYHLYLENLTDFLISWFRKETGYIIVPNRKWLDLIYPNTFQYDTETILIDAEKIKFKVTEHSNNNEVTFIDHTGRNRNLSPDKDGYFEYKLELEHVYIFQLKHELCNELIIKRIDEINPVTNFHPTILVNEQPYELMDNNAFNQSYSVESEHYFQVYLENAYPYRAKEMNNQLPKVLHIPYLGTIHKRRKVGAIEQLNLKMFTVQERYIVVNNSEFIKVIEIIKKSKIPNKMILISTLMKQYNRLPEQVVKYIRKEVLR